MADDTGKKSTAQIGDHVTFNSQALAGNRGLVVERPDTPEGKLAVVHAARDDLTVVDRAFFHPGQMVASASDPAGQAGIVTAVDAVIDLVDSDSDKVVVARGVPQSRLRGVTELVEGDFVTSGPWLGRLLGVSVDVDVRFDDGAVCRVASVTKRHGGIRPADAYSDDDSLCLFYPGQHVRATDASVFQAARWLSGQWQQSAHAEGGAGGTVARVELADALVFWVASARLGGGTKRRELVQAPAPPPQQRARDLAFFCSDDHSFWGLGERCFLRDADAPTPPTSSGTTTPPMSVVADTRTTVDVLWQDGTRGHGVPSASLVHFDSHAANEFIPGHRVVSLDAAVGELTPADDDGPAAAVPRVGIVRGVNWKDQTVRVSWLSGGPVPCGEEETTVVSAYDLAPDYDHGVFYGDVVVRIVGDYKVAAADAADAAGADLSWVGQVVDVSDSHVLVKWGDGNTSKRFCVPVGDNSSSATANDSDSEDNYSADTKAKGRDGDSIHALAAMEMKSVVEVAAAGVVARPASFGEGGVDDGSGPSPTKKKAAADVATSGDDSFQFPKLDVMQCPPDHHFLLHDKEQGTGDVKKWTKRVQKEWEILQNNLPDTMYVRAFEDRMDLLRAAMVGAAGTPYHDGLFFFDMQLPPSYPAVPPLVHYHSFGLWLNPNLGDSGDVCLSLLDDGGSTGGGAGPEHWSLASSSILQVVVSLQGLVLTAQPYYNESGYAFQLGTPHGARNAPPYTENAYVLTLRTMLHLLRRPPPAGYEALVAGHFRRRGRFVLRACEAYLQGCPVGALDAEARATAAAGEGEGRGRPCSAGLRLALNGIVPRLVEAFTEIGADGCEEFGRLRLPLAGGGDVAPPCN